METIPSQRDFCGRGRLDPVPAADGRPRPGDKHVAHCRVLVYSEITQKIRSRLYSREARIYRINSSMVKTLQKLPGMNSRQNKLASDLMNGNSREKLRLALRVLTTLTQGGSCSPEDACALRRIAGGLDESSASLDDLACLVIHREREALSIRNYSDTDQRDTAATCRFSRLSS